MTTTSDTETVFMEFRYSCEGRRMGYLDRIRYAVLVLLGKRRDYPICICAFGRDVEE